QRATNSVCSSPVYGEGGGRGEQARIFLHAPSLTLRRLRGRGHTERGEGSMSSVRRGYPSNRTEMKMHQRQSTTDMKTIHLGRSRRLCRDGEDGTPGVSLAALSRGSAGAGQD